MTSREPSFEIHALQPLARRSRSGIWNADVLPVTEWEAPHQRVVIPANLHGSLDPISPVLRWDAEKYLQVITEHAADRHVIDDLTSYLPGWVYHGRERGRPHQRVLFPDEFGRWYAVSIGRLLGSDNMITIVGSSRRGFLANRLAGDGICEDVNQVILDPSAMSGCLGVPRWWRSAMDIASSPATRITW